LLILISWIYVYADSKGQKIFIVQWINSIKKRLYMLLINRFYIDLSYERWSRNILRLAQKLGHGF
ncbi:MAG: NADH-quinone oxidoreductase subunit L, partial [Nitrospinota bacterium]|nr:NADH-quinone oxidoreductase subunit L [Nitrospinota bacterium]